MQQPRAVVFDCFGTLVRIGQAKHPYRQLQRLMAAHGRPAQREDNIRMLTSNEMKLADFALSCGVTVPGESLARIEADLAAELGALDLYEDAASTIERLRLRGIRVAVCSNAATPYAMFARTLLPQLDAYAWSCEIGAVKPRPVIYEHVCAYLDSAPEHLVFVGDSVDADFHGPREYGMHAVHLVRDGEPEVHPYIRSLAEIR